MDLGIAGRKAIVCASSRGLGRACALALAHAKCEVVINGREGKALQATAAELRTATGSKIIEVQADLATADGQAALLQACPTTTRDRHFETFASSPVRRWLMASLPIWWSRSSSFKK